MISTASAPFTPRFRPHSTLNWLVTVQWWIRLTENWQITKAVWPHSLRLKNRKITGLSVLTSYLCLEFIFVLTWLNLMYFLVLCVMKINGDSSNKKDNVMRRISFVVLILSKNTLELNCILSLTRLYLTFWLVLCDLSDEKYFVTGSVKILFHENVFHSWFRFYQRILKSWIIF